MMDHTSCESLILVTLSAGLYFIKSRYVPRSVTLSQLALNSLPTAFDLRLINYC